MTYITTLGEVSRLKMSVTGTIQLTGYHVLNLSWESNLNFRGQGVLPRTILVQVYKTFLHDKKHIEIRYIEEDALNVNTQVKICL